MKTEQILKECKDEIARKYKFSYYSSMTLDNQAYYMEQAMHLYSQRMSEKFAEWIRSNNYQSNGSSMWSKITLEGNIKLRKHTYHYTSELYAEFIEQLNKD